MIQIEKKLQELETKARGLITEIVPLIGKLPKAALSELTEFLDDALKTAKTNLDASKKETEKVVRRHSWVGRMFAFILIAILFGCVPKGYVKPTENQKEMHQQTIGAAQVAAEKSTDPDGKQAALDAKLTAETTQKTLVGEPEVKKPYSHPEVVRIVEIVKKEYDESKAPWYKRWAGTLLGGLGTLATLLGVVGYFYPPAGVVAGVLKPVAAMLTSTKQTADAHPDDVIHIDTLQTKITALTKLPGIGPVLNDLLAKAHVDMAVHSPEASDLPPTPTA